MLEEMQQRAENLLQDIIGSSSLSYGRNKTGFDRIAWYSNQIKILGISLGRLESYMKRCKYNSKLYVEYNKRRNKLDVAAQELYLEMIEYIYSGALKQKGK